jgi:CBS domain-containing protein
MNTVTVIPGAAVAQVTPLLRAAGWRAAPLLDRAADDRDAAFDLVRRGDPALVVPGGARVARKLERIVVVHEGNRGDRAGMDAADDAALASGAELVVVHTPASTSDPVRGSLAFRFADHGEYDLEEWRHEFLRRFCRCSPSVRVTLRVGAGPGPLLADQVQSASPDLVIVSGPPEAESGKREPLAALLEGDVPVLIVPSVGRDRSAQAGAERGQRKTAQSSATSALLHVRDVMTTPVVSVELSTPLKEVAQVLIDHHVSGVPVIGPGGAVSGVVTEADFLVKAQGAE